MQVTLLNKDGHFNAHAQIINNADPLVIVRDGTPYLRVDQGTYKMVDDWVEITTRLPVIEIAKKFDPPFEFEARTTRWWLGDRGVVTAAYKVPIELPTRIRVTLDIEGTFAFIVNGVWTARGGKGQGEAVQRSNAFCNRDRPPGSRLMMKCLALDTRGRMVCDITKHLRAIGSVPGPVLHLRKHLLESPAFQPAVWRME